MCIHTVTGYTDSLGPELTSTKAACMYSARIGFDVFEPSIGVLYSSLPDRE